MQIYFSNAQQHKKQEVIFLIEKIDFELISLSKNDISNYFTRVSNAKVNKKINSLLNDIGIQACNILKTDNCKLKMILLDTSEIMVLAHLNDINIEDTDFAKQFPQLIDYLDDEDYDEDDEEWDDDYSDLCFDDWDDDIDETDIDPFDFSKPLPINPSMEQCIKEYVKFIRFETFDDLKFLSLMDIECTDSLLYREGSSYILEIRGSKHDKAIDIFLMEIGKYACSVDGCSLVISSHAIDKLKGYFLYVKNQKKRGK